MGKRGQDITTQFSHNIAHRDKEFRDRVTEFCKSCHHRIRRGYTDQKCVRCLINNRGHNVALTLPIRGGKYNGMIIRLATHKSKAGI